MFEPEWVAELGNAFYASLAKDRTQDHDRAYRVIDDFYERFDSYPKDSKEWKYMCKMYLSAQGLGNGKMSRKREYRETVENAKAEMDKKLDISCRRTYFGKLLNNVQAVFAGIGTYFVAKGILNYIDPGFDPTLGEGISFGAAYTAAETVDTIESVIRKNKVRRITSKCETASENAKTRYRKEVSKEYDFALRRCRKAWEESFGKKAPNGDSDISWLLAA